MLGIGSTEYRLKTKLDELDCSIRKFAAIFEKCGVEISRSLITMCLAEDNNKTFDYAMGQKLLEIADELKLARDFLGGQLPKGLPINWNETEKVIDLRILSLFQKISEENQ